MRPYSALPLLALCSALRLTEASTGLSAPISSSVDSRSVFTQALRSSASTSFGRGGARDSSGCISGAEDAPTFVSERRRRPLGRTVTVRDGLSPSSSNHFAEGGGQGGRAPGFFYKREALGTVPPRIRARPDACYPQPDACTVMAKTALYPDIDFSEA